MPKSKAIQDYFEASINQLKAGTEFPVSIHIFFPINKHILMLRRVGESITDAFIVQYKQRGLQTIWIHNSEKPEWLKYLEPPKPKAEPQLTTEAPPLPKGPATVEGQKITEALKADVPLEQKKEAVAEPAKAVVAEIAQAKTVEEQRAANQKAQAVVQDVLEAVLADSAAVSEAWSLANLDRDLTHGLNVSTYVVLFAMAFGKIEDELLRDLAHAGLLHDLGVSQLSPELASTPWNKLTADQLKVYHTHVQAGVKLMAELDSRISERTKSIILQHHEKFDGTGYPSALKGFQVDDISQLLGMAELLISISSGQWDSQERTLADTLSTLEGLEKARTFPEHFNPEIFSAVMKWTRNEKFKDATKEAAKVVGQQTEAFISKR